MILPVRLSKLPDTRKSFVDLLLMPLHLGHNPGDAAPMACDD